MDIIGRLRDATSLRWTGIYLRILAGVLVYGALVHVGNMVGFGGEPWSEMPIHFRVMDLLLLIFNGVVAVGLWSKSPWAVIAFVLGLVLLQIIPYTVFRQHFVQTPEDASTLNGLIGTEIVLIALLFFLILAKK